MKIMTPDKNQKEIIRLVHPTVTPPLKYLIKVTTAKK